MLLGNRYVILKRFLFLNIVIVRPQAYIFGSKLPSPGNGYLYYLQQGSQLKCGCMPKFFISFSTVLGHVQIISAIV